MRALPLNNQRDPTRSGDPWVRAAHELVVRGVMTNAQLDDALKSSANTDLIASKSTSQVRQSFIDVLVDSGHCTRQELVAQLASLAMVPYIYLTAEMIDPTASHVFQREFLERNELLPVSCDEGMITIGCECFADSELAHEIERITGCEVVFIASDAITNREVRDLVLGPVQSTVESAAPESSIQNLICESEIKDIRVVEESVQEDADLNAASDSPVVNLVNRILASAYEQKASDIHIEPWIDGFIVRYRIDGKLRTIAEPPRGLLSAIISRIKILSKLDISERRIPQDGAFAVTVGDAVIEFRVSTMTTKYGEKAVMRLVEHGSSIPSLHDLGINESSEIELRAMSTLPNGMLLVTGPTGSGKTTTLYSLLDEACSEDRNISTLEDPVERKIKGASQFQINDKAGFGFSMALRSILRQDPDVIMVGEIRDKETAELAVQASLTGHLVLSTLHTNDSISSLQRLHNMGVEPYLIAASLRCVLAQRLIGRLCQRCKTLVSNDQLTSRFTGTPYILNSTSFEAPGCTSCAKTGIKGRIGVYELLILDEQISESILLSNDHGVTPEPSMLEDGLSKVHTGLISLRDLLAVVPCPNELSDHDHTALRTRRSA